jgi:hypothetical protein
MERTFAANAAHRVGMAAVNALYLAGAGSGKLAEDVSLACRSRNPLRSQAGFSQRLHSQTAAVANHDSWLGSVHRLAALKISVPNPVPIAT